MVDFKNRLEVPFNFHDDFLYYIEKIKPFIRYVYAQPFNTDGWHARINGGTWIPDTWKEYSNRIIQLIEHGYKVFVLLQETDYSDMQIINKYIDIGVSGFITSCDKLASYIKEKNIRIGTICSITKLLSFKDICTDDLSMYDAIVLNFPFERGIDAVKKLPSKYKYHMIINNGGCVYNCKYQKYHWTNGKRANRNVLPCKDFNNTIEKHMIIYPNDLDYFDKYIDVFKLQGREYESRNICNEILNFRDKNNTLKHDLDYFNDAIKDGTIKL